MDSHQSIQHIAMHGGKARTVTIATTNIYLLAVGSSADWQELNREYWQSSASKENQISEPLRRVDV
jgi:hypothetical protein